MIDRRQFVSSVGLGLLTLPHVHEVGAQEPKPTGAGKIPTVGLLRLGVPDLTTPAFVAFRQGLRDLGYAEGQNIVLEYRPRRSSSSPLL